MPRRRRRARKVARTAGRYAMSGIKGAALQAATGAVAELGAAAIAARLPFVAQNWWATPAGLAVLGILMKRRQRLRGLGDAMLGAAGYAGAQNYTLARAVSATAGETAALYDGREAGMLVGGELPPLSDYQNPTSSRFVEEGTPAGSVETAMLL